MRVLLAIMMLVAFSCSSASQESPSPDLNDRVLVVENGASPASRNVAKYYMSKRDIPKENLCSIKPAGPMMYVGALDWNPFIEQVQNPIRKCLEKAGKRRILYIVFSYDTPYIVFGSPIGRGAALDQFVADVWDEAGKGGQTRNPYYLDAQSKSGTFPRFVPFSVWRNSQTPTIYSVWHLEGESPDAARTLVDKALTAEQKGLMGTVCIDRQYGDQLAEMPDEGYAAGDWDLYRAAELFRKAGLPVEEDTHKEEFGTPPAPVRCENAIFFAGWYSLSHYNDAFSWKPGAIGIHLDSNSATNLREGTSWVANSLKKGITITSGAIGEPYLTGLPHPDVVAYVLLAGGNAGDAFLASTAYLRWMIVNVGDPLYRPKLANLQRSSTGAK